MKSDQKTKSVSPAGVVQTEKVKSLIYYQKVLQKQYGFATSLIKSATMKAELALKEFVKKILNIN